MRLCTSLIILGELWPALPNYAFLYGVFYIRNVIDYVVNVCRLGFVVLPNVLNVVRCLMECGMPHISRSVRCPRY